MNAAVGITLDGDDVDACFPFHIVVDRSMRIARAGRVLSRLLPMLHGRRFNECFAGLRTRIEAEFEALGRDPRRLFTVQSVDEPLIVLRGQMLSTSPDEVFFLASPRLSLDSMERLGVSVSDFAPHDSTGDYLLILRAQQSSLEEAATLADSLALANEELERRVDERTRELSASNKALSATADDLAATLAALELSNDRLAREVNDRIRVEGELRVAHRLEAVGALASGIAHELNTPIQYVSDSLQFVKDALHDAGPFVMSIPPLIERLQMLGVHEEAKVLADAWEAADLDFTVEHMAKAMQRTLDGVARVAEIVGAMKAFAHPDGQEMAPGDINDGVRNVLEVARNEYKYVAEIETSFGELPLVTCHLGELNQVFLNLVVNAAHAVAEARSGTDQRGRITITTAQQGADVLVTITDDGPGIPEAIRSRVFDPFFTTKPVGKGTGQGLTIARTIVERHRGTLTFESRLEGGTRFVVRLPAGAPAAEAA